MSKKSRDHVTTPSPGLFVFPRLTLYMSYRRSFNRISDIYYVAQNFKTNHVTCHGVVGAYGYISRRNCFSRLLGFPSARVACVAAEVTRYLGRNFPLHVSRALRSRHACCGCLLSWLSGSFRRYLWAANVGHSM